MSKKSRYRNRNKNIYAVKNQFKTEDTSDSTIAKTEQEHIEKAQTASTPANQSQIKSWLATDQARKAAFMVLNLPLMAVYVVGLLAINRNIGSSLSAAQQEASSTTMLYCMAIGASILFIAPIAGGIFYLLKLVYHRRLDGFTLGITFITELYFVYAFLILPFRNLPDPNQEPTKNFILKGVLYKCLAMAVTSIVAIV